MTHQPRTDMEPYPNLAHEEELWGMGFCRVAGIDEAGRGALAGPVVAAAVVLPRRASVEWGQPASLWRAVRDSKQLTPRQRAELDRAIRAAADAVGVGMADPQIIDEIGIAPATRRAMMQALARLARKPDHLLVDWVRLPQCATPQRCFAKADALSVSVAAASIVAKTARDAYMMRLDAEFPGYGFAGHKGYGVAAHLAALARLGPCAAHRHSFAPVARRHTLFDAPDTGGAAGREPRSAYDDGA